MNQFYTDDICIEFETMNINRDARSLARCDI